VAGLGRTLAQCKIRGTNLVRFAILINQMNPGIVVASALYSAYNDFGLLPAQCCWCRRRSSSPGYRRSGQIVSAVTAFPTI
jgi:ABC-type spermidine/putrescine transport system permease subunit II